MCVPVVVCIRHDDARSVTSRAIVHRPPARSLDRPILCLVYACVTRLVLGFTSSMLRALPVTLPFRPWDFTLHTSRRGALYIILSTW